MQFAGMVFLAMIFMVLGALAGIEWLLHHYFWYFLGAFVLFLAFNVWWTVLLPEQQAQKAQKKSSNYS